MNNQWLLFLVLALIPPGCGNGDGGNDDADAAEAAEDQEAAEEINDGDVPAEDNQAEFDPEQACIDSGGSVDTMLCCLSADDFPNLCGFGACGCSPANSHEVRGCLCGAGRCFDGSGCVPR